MVGELMRLDNSIPMLPYGPTIKQHKKLCRLALSPDAVAKYIPIQEDAAAVFVLRSIQDPMKRVPSWIPFNRIHSIAKSGRDLIFSMVDRPFQRVKSDYEAGIAQPSFVTDCLEKFEREQGEEESGLSKDERDHIIRWAAGAMYGAGGESTYATILSFILAMALFPIVQSKIHAELNSVVGSGRLPSIEDRKNLPYLDAAIKEALRWRPALPLSIARRNNKADCYRGYHIPEGTIVIPNVWAISQRETGNGDYPASGFAPERFLSRKEPAADPSTYAFGFGRRACPGKYMGENNLFCLISMLMVCVKISPKVDREGRELRPNPEYSSGLVSIRKGRVMIHTNYGYHRGRDKNKSRFKFEAFEGRNPLKASAQGPKPYPNAGRTAWLRVSSDSNMLPIELWEAIIDHLQGALVCKPWLSKSRQHLFSRPRYFLKLGANNANAFHGLVHDSRSTLKYHITSVELNGYSFLQPDGHQDVDDLIRLSQAIIDGCTSLGSLKLYGAQKAFPLLTSRGLFSTLTTLHLGGTLWGWGTQASVQAGKFLDFVGNFTVLESLSMSYDTPGRYIGGVIHPRADQSDGVGTKKAGLRFLSDLDLDLIWSVFIPWFLVPGVLRSPALETLEISLTNLPNRERHVPLLQEYLELFAISLKDLAFSFAWDNVPVLDLSHLKALRCVVFKGGLFCEPEEQVHFQDLCNMVSTRREDGEIVQIRSR
ncbi:hypothetical protein V5O48_005680 [Marasmius crinis-equi]|uniref:Cytochrome P450 n=1 Tax=Marasmius crinis-equi TaxID=585013 RepID=A0ABR3FLK8_9AGAR